MNSKEIQENVVKAVYSGYISEYFSSFFAYKKHIYIVSTKVYTEYNILMLYVEV